MRAAPRDKTLSDDEWAQIAGDVMNRTGLSRYGEEDEGVRWIAVRHGDDHIHIVAMLARQDGRRWRLDFEKKRVREACLAAEERYGLESTAPGDSTAARLAVPRRDREGRPPRPGRAAARHAAPPGHHRGSRSPQRSGVLRPPGGSRGAGPEAAQRQEPGPGHRVRGRAARRHRQGRRAGVVRRREARRGPELAQAPLPLGRPGTAPGDPFTAAERNALWDHAARSASQAAAQIRALAGTDPAAAADAAWAASDTLHAAAAALGSRILRQAADAYDRAARSPYARIPAPTPAGNSLRRAARLIAAFAYLTKDPSLAPIVLLTRLASLAEAVAGLRQAQQHAAQAAGALRAAERLHAAAGTPAGPGRSQPAQVLSPAALAGASFPAPPRPAPPTPSRPPGAGQPRALPRRPAAVAAHNPRPASSPPKETDI